MASWNLAELSILDWIGRVCHNPFLDALMPKLSFLADGGWLWIVLALLLMIKRPTRKIGLTVALALLGSLLAANVLLKPLVARVRPFTLNPAVQLLVAAPHDFSFPSGHTQASFAAAAALYLHSKKPGAAALVLAALIAFSRLYLYVHYPSDVLAGLAIGVILGCLAYRLVKNLGRASPARGRRRRRDQSSP